MNLRELEHEVSFIKSMGEFDKQRVRDLMAEFYRLNGQFQLLLNHLNLQHVTEVADGKTKEFYRTKSNPFG